MKSIVIAGLSTVFALLIVEIGLRVLDPLDFQPHASREMANVPLGASPFYFCEGGPQQLVAHPVVNSRELPNQRYFEFLNDSASLIETNEYGFRGEFDLGDAEERILVLGDSFVRGTLADETETIPALLSQWSQGTHFVNLGTGGHGTMQHALTYQEFKDTIPHEVVLLFVFNGNDLADNLDFKAWQDDPEANSREPSAMQRLKQMLFTLHVGKLLQRFKEGYLDGYRYSSTPSEDEEELLAQSLAELSRSVADQGARLFVFSLPEASEFFEDKRMSLREDAVGYGNATRGLLQEAAEENGFTYLDLKPVLEDAAREAGIPTSELFGNPDYHLREPGNFAVARAAAQLLQENGAAVVVPDAEFMDRTSFDPSNVACS
ncbi:SGNH/GDSL hydrolase family protein [Aurantiacibacter hainanensis]|uniref:SGNH/GDSL hydrolase family protein n=1 Tax=Aurantiacibacter hainanensis TaxID=3076114 RepID=UPI0030C756AA